MDLSAALAEMQKIAKIPGELQPHLKHSKSGSTHNASQWSACRNPSLVILEAQNLLTLKKVQHEVSFLGPTALSRHN